MTQHNETEALTDDATVAPPPQPGRPVVLVPTPPGLWMVLLGVSVAALAPLLGFLWGSTFGPGEEGAAYGPIYIGLLGGVLVGGLGVLLAAYGGLRLYRHSWHQRVTQEAENVRDGRAVGGH